MKVIVLILFLASFVHEQQAQKTRVPLLREGTKIIEANGSVRRLSNDHPIVIDIENENDRDRAVDSFIILPNQRLAEMEAAAVEFPDRSFRISGDVFAYGDRNYLLVREAVSLGDHTERNHPDFIPTNPNQEILQEEDFDDSVADIVKELEVATGSLVRSIRDAAKYPVEQSTVNEGARISARRCHLVRNNSGAWIAVFVSDSTGLRDPPCTILPSASFAELTSWASALDPSTPVLLSGELLSYHGHGFLLVRTWRPVHNTDHLD